MKPVFDHKEVILAYRKAHEGKLTNEQIEKNLKEYSESMAKFDHTSELLFANRYNAEAQIVTIAGWVWIHATVVNGKSTEGNGGGLFFPPGGGGYWGHIYTDDLEGMYRDSISFEVNLSLFYCSILFFDAHSKVLGHFQGGGVGNSTGIGGGKLTGWK